MKRPRPEGVGCGATRMTRSSAASTEGAYWALSTPTRVTAVSKSSSASASSFGGTCSRDWPAIDVTVFGGEESSRRSLEFQSGHDVRPVASTVARYALKLVVAKT